MKDNNYSKKTHYSFFDTSTQKNVKDNPTDAFAPVLNNLNTKFVECINKNIDNPKKCDPIKDLLTQQIDLIKGMNAIDKNLIGDGADHNNDCSD